MQYCLVSLLRQWHAGATHCGSCPDAALAKYGHSGLQLRGQSLLGIPALFWLDVVDGCRVSSAA
jgi:hypothetical protein